MIVDLHVHLADLIVIAMFAAAGVCLVVWAVACFLRWASARVTDWLHTRIDPPWWWKPWLSSRVEDDDYPGVPYAIPDGPDSTGELVDWEPLPPERTWEQMTSHQLPLATDWDQRCYNPCKHDPLHATARCGPCHLVWPQLAERRERRAPWWEADHRAHYVAMGLEYPSGLMARVRELAP